MPQLMINTDDIEEVMLELRYSLQDSDIVCAVISSLQERQIRRDSLLNGAANKLASNARRQQPLNRALVEPFTSAPDEPQSHPKTADDDIKLTRND